MGATTDGYTFGTVSQVNKTQVMTFSGSFSIFSVTNLAMFDWGLSGAWTYSFPYNVSTGDTGYSYDFDQSFTETADGNTVAGMLNGSPLSCDQTYQMRAHANHVEKGTHLYGSTLYFKTYTINATANDPSASSITSSSATLSGYWYPNTVESYADAFIQYKTVSSGTWTNGPYVANQTGYSILLLTGSVTGLAASTTYQVRTLVHQKGTNDQYIASNTITFTTAAAAPTITTNAANIITSSGANLNGTVNPHGVSTTVHFEWGTTTAYGNTTATQGPDTSSTDDPFAQWISGLSASTLYHFRAVAVAAGVTYNGLDASFTTPGDPQAAALLEDHMLVREFNERKYGVATKVVFQIASPSATSSDRFFNAASPFATGDVQVAQETTIGGGLGSFANVGTLPARIGTTSFFELSLTATEMQGYTVVVQIVDQDGPAYRDAAIIIRTTKQLGTEAIDATAIGGNTAAVTLTGIGTGAGLVVAGGATAAGDITGYLNSDKLRKGVAQAGGASTITLDSSASAVDNYYAGSIISVVSGTGAGQSRVCASYVGSTKVATMTRGWVTNPAVSSVFIITPGPEVWYDTHAELASIPAMTGTYGDKCQLLAQRFALKITQTATTQTWFKVDGATSLGTRSVSDNGTTQTTGALS